jgi:FSR family fosmidomycin resistance protein-like MFS transporter
VFGPSRQKLTLAACCGAHIGQDGLTATTYVLLPVLAQSLGLGYGQVGILRAAQTSAMWLLEMPAGILAERFGAARLLVFGLICAGLGYASLAFATDFYGVVAALFMAGCGAAFQHSLSSSLVSQAYRGPSRRTALGTYNASGDVGKLLFTGTFGVLAGAGVQWQGITLGFGAVVVAIGIALYLLLRTARKAIESVESSNETVPDASKSRGWGIRHRPAFVALACIVGIDIMVQDAFFIFIPFVMLEKEVPTSLAALAVVLTLAGGVFGKFGCGLLAAKFGVVRSLILAEFLTAIGIISIMLAPTLIAFLILPFLGFVLQGSSSITYGAVSELVSEERQARGFAAIYTVSNAASIAGAVGFGLISDLFGLDVSLSLMAAVVLLPIAFSIVLRQGYVSQSRTETN